MSFNIFFNKQKFLSKYFRSILAVENFRSIEPDSYVIKTNRFGDILAKNFFNSSVDAISAGSGAMRYNVEESVLLADWNITPKTSGEKKVKKFSCLGLVHLRKIPFSFKLKVSSSKALRNIPEIFSGLLYPVGSDVGGIFKLSSDDSGRTLNQLSAGFVEFFDPSGPMLQFFKKTSTSCIIFSDSGWVIFSTGPYASDTLNAMLVLDKKVLEILSRKNG
jgi:hypothetical protein